MGRSIYFSLVLLNVILLINACFLPGKAFSGEPVNIGNRLELFVDSLLIDRLKGVELRLNHPVKQPLASSRVRASMSTVIKDGYIYRYYYRSLDADYKGETFSGSPGEITCYAESHDGHEWVFPNLGLYDAKCLRTLENNVVLAGNPPFSHNFSPFLDNSEGVDPKERYKALAGHPRGGLKPGETLPGRDGLHAFVSADGINWLKVGERPVIPFDTTWRHAFDSQNVSFWSEEEQLYVCYFRTWDTPHGHLRSVSRTTSPDFFNWSKAISVEPNMPGEHLYTTQTHPYFRAPHIYISLPTRFIPGIVMGEEVEGNVGQTDIMFMTKRAGSDSFDRLFREAFIRPGIHPEMWRSRENYVAQNVVQTGPEEMSIYHRNGQRYSLRIDGFVSVRAGAIVGELITKPLIFSGNKLKINFSTSAGGSIQVEIWNENGEPVSGFQLKDCPKIIGDKIEHIVEWQGSPELGTIAGKPVRLRFLMKDCDLYSFRFK